MTRTTLEHAVKSGKQVYRLSLGRIPVYEPITVDTSKAHKDGLCYWTSDNGWSYWDATVYVP